MIDPRRGTRNTEHIEDRTRTLSTPGTVKERPVEGVGNAPKFLSADWDAVVEVMPASNLPRANPLTNHPADPGGCRPLYVVIEILTPEISNPARS